MSDAREDKNRRILVIDDNSAVHNDFKKILGNNTTACDLDQTAAALFGDEVTLSAKDNYEIDSAHQGKEGLAKVIESVEDECPFAMAFVDMRMPPGWDGLETIEHLWEVDPDIQVVICTAYSDHSWEEISARLGNSSNFLILKKPFDCTEAAQLASSLTEKRRLSQLAALKMNDLERMVAERTRELADAREEARRYAKELAAANRVLHKAALTDALTGLPNRRYLIERLDQEWAESARHDRPLACLMLDVDHFKRFNDTHGHDVGDEVLRHTAKTLKASCRTYDVLCRYGGEEFIVLCPNVDLDSAPSIAERMRVAIESNTVETINGLRLSVTISIGVAASNSYVRDAVSLLKAADEALYAAKNAGRNCVVAADLKQSLSNCSDE